MDDDRQDLIYRLGMLLYQDSQFKKSLEYLRRYISYQPKDITVIKILADILYNLNRLPEAIDNYKRLIELDQHKASYYYNIANSSPLRYSFSRTVCGSNTCLTTFFCLKTFFSLLLVSG